MALIGDLFHMALNGKTITGLNMIKKDVYLSIRFYNSCRRLPETKRHSSLFLH